jgi:hypothetical protein
MFGAAVTVLVVAVMMATALGRCCVSSCLGSRGRHELKSTPLHVPVPGTSKSNNVDLGPEYSTEDIPDVQLPPPVYQHDPPPSYVDSDPGDMV